jgi:hypothetical protein
VPLVEETLVHSSEEARAAFDAAAPRVVMKIASPDFPHRSDVGLVKLDVSSGDDAAAVYDELTTSARKLNAGATIDGVIVQPQIGDGVELLVGVSRDPVLGAAIAVGLGGIFTEVFDDVAVRPLPLDRADAAEMVASLRSAPLLHGARGRAPVNVDSVLDVLLNVARLARDVGPRLAELDINPLIVDEHRAVAVDFLAILGGNDLTEAEETSY